jgi:hypothetical protein
MAKLCNSVQLRNAIAIGTIPSSSIKFKLIEINLILKYSFTLNQLIFVVFWM